MPANSRWDLIRGLKGLNSNQCQKKWGESRYKLPWPDPVEGARVLIMLHNYAFAFLDSIITCRLYKFTLSAQTQVTLQLRASLSEWMQRFLAGPPLLVGGRGGEGGQKHFLPGPEPSVGGPHPNYCPGWRGFKFVVPLNALMTVWSTEASSMWRVAGPCSAPRPALEG